MAKFQKGTDGVYRVHFESLSALLAQAENKSDLRDINASAYEGYASACNRFTNQYSLDMFEKDLTNPPRCGAKVRAITAEISADRVVTENTRKLVGRLADGDELNAGAWVRRELDGWSQTKKVQRQKRVIRIACNVSVSALRKPEELYYRGAAAAALADILEAAGHSVEITMFTSQLGLFESKSDSMSVMSCTVKQADAPMDLDSVALALAEIGVFRTVTFCAWATAATMKTSGSLGYPELLPRADRQGYDVIFESDILSKEAAIHALRRYTTGFDADTEAAP